MSLNFDLAEIENSDKVCYEDGRMSQVTEALIFATMFVDMGDINKQTIDEFVARVQFYEAVTGAMLFTYSGEPGEQPEPRPLTEKEIRAHVGLRTNVAYVPRKRWVARIATHPKVFPGEEPK